MRFRSYEPTDRPACIRVFESNIPVYFSTWELELFEGFLDRLPGRYGVVLDEQGEVVGCGGLAASKNDPRIANLTWGMVRADLHGKGYGSALVRGRLAWLPEMPEIEAVRIETSHLTEKFYETKGFRTFRREDNHYREGLHRCDMEMVVPRPGGSPG